MSGHETPLASPCGAEEPARHGLTPRQLECARVIQEFIDEFGHAPTYGELAHELGLASRHSAYSLVTRLVERGFVQRRRGPRDLTLLHRVPPAPESEFTLTELGAAEAERLRKSPSDAARRARGEID